MMKFLIFSFSTHLLLLGFLWGMGFSSSPHNISSIIEVQVMEVFRDLSAPAFEGSQAASKVESAAVEKQTNSKDVEEVSSSSDSSDLERMENSPAGQELTDVQQLQMYLEKRKVYPRMALRLKHSGVVQIRLFIEEDGRIGETEIFSPSPFETLNRAALNLVSGLRLPADFRGRGAFVVPISYQLKGSSL